MPTAVARIRHGSRGHAGWILAPNHDQCTRLMTDTSIFGDVSPCLNTEATQGNGDLYSTGADMALWLSHNLDTVNPVA